MPATTAFPVKPKLRAALLVAVLASAGCSGTGRQAATPVPGIVSDAPAQLQAPTAAPSEAPAAEPVGGGGGAATEAGRKWVTVAGDPTLLVLPAGDGSRRPALIYVHGHNGDRTQLDQTALAQAATQAGWIAAAGDFTGKAHWGNDGAQRAIANLVAELVANHAADPDRIYLVGFSMGGGTALLTAANPLGLPWKAAAVVSTQGFSDLKAMQLANFGGFARSVADAYGGEPTGDVLMAHSPKFQAEKLAGVPVYLEHGEADTVVPPDHTRWMASALTAAGQTPVVRFHAGKGHGEDTIDTPAVMAFLKDKRAVR